MELTIGRESWTYKAATVYEKVTDQDPWDYPDQFTICSLFWRLVGVVPSLPLFAILAVVYFFGWCFYWIIEIFPWLRRLGRLGRRVGRYFGIAFITTVFTLASFALVFIAMLDLADLLQVIGICILFIMFLAGITLVASKVDERRSETKRSVVVQYAKTFKRKLCPIVRVADGQTTEGES